MGVLVYKKHTSSHDFFHEDFLHGCIMHILRTCFRIGLLLVALILITTLFRIGSLFGLVACLIVVEAWLVTSWPC